jgi:hypothetical protein
VDTLEGKDLEVGSNGEIDIVLSRRRPLACQNWMRLADDPPEGLLIVRQTFLDKKSERPADLRIVRIPDSSDDVKESEKATPSSLTAERVESALQSTTLLVCGASLMFSRWVAGFQKHTNQLPLFSQSLSNRFDTHTFSHSASFSHSAFFLQSLISLSPSSLAALVVIQTSDIFIRIGGWPQRKRL